MTKFKSLQSVQQRKRRLRRQLRAERQTMQQCARQMVEGVRSPFSVGLRSADSATRLSGIIGGAILGYRIYKSVRKIAKIFS